MYIYVAARAHGGTHEKHNALLRADSVAWLGLGCANHAHASHAGIVCSRDERRARAYERSSYFFLCTRACTLCWHECVYVYACASIEGLCCCCCCCCRCSQPSHLFYARNILRPSQFEVRVAVTQILETQELDLWRHCRVFAKFVSFVVCVHKRDATRARACVLNWSDTHSSGADNV